MDVHKITISTIKGRCRQAGIQNEGDAIEILRRLDGVEKVWEE